MSRPLSGERLTRGSQVQSIVWTMTRHGRVATCVLWASPELWELRVTVDTEPLLVRRAPILPDLLRLAAHWKSRMADIGWTAAVPAPAIR